MSDKPFCIPAAAFLYADAATYGPRTMEPLLDYPDMNRIFVDREGANGSNVIGTNRSLLAVARTPIDALWTAPQFDCWISLDGDVQDHIRTSDASAIWFYPQQTPEMGAYIIMRADGSQICSGQCTIGRQHKRLRWRSLLNTASFSPLRRNPPPVIGGGLLRRIAELAYIAKASLSGHACDPDEGEEDNDAGMRLYFGEEHTAVFIQTENPLYAACVAPRSTTEDQLTPIDISRFVWPPWSTRDGE